MECVVSEEWLVKHQSRTELKVFFCRAAHRCCSPGHHCDAALKQNEAHFKEVRADVLHVSADGGFESRTIKNTEISKCCSVKILRNSISFTDDHVFALAHRNVIHLIIHREALLRFSTGAEPGVIVKTAGFHQLHWNTCEVLMSHGERRLILKFEHFLPADTELFTHGRTDGWEQHWQAWSRTFCSFSPSPLSPAAPSRYHDQK